MNRALTPHKALLKRCTLTHAALLSKVARRARDAAAHDDDDQNGGFVVQSSSDFSICKTEQTWWEESSKGKTFAIVSSSYRRKKRERHLSPNDRYAVTSNPFYDVDTEKYSRQISEKANEKKRATADGNTGKTANGTSTVASSTVAKADFSGVVRERWEKVHLSSEDERAKGSADVSIVRLNENAFKMKMKLNCPSILMNKTL